ncbi:hypothetical protein KQI46_11620 [Lysinibacillus capsici]|uniref:hypothetical protein n=1 Tax=Lysinibacillus capsici TaxID=2115968 RepID=UPI001C10B8C7|nr:hypothetical protein [Lysinibacillus capsici]MBU5252546.1 hypothetical protein [Lysinibacillus capsici]
MKSYIYSNKSILAEVNILNHKLPSRQTQRINSLGGGSMLVQGNTVPGSVIFEVPVGIDLFNQRNLEIDLNDRTYRLEISGERYMSGVRVITGMIY